MVPFEFEHGDTTELSVNSVIDQCFTRFEMLLPNGIEHWFVKNFEFGPGKSKWFRGVSVPYPSLNEFVLPNGEKLAKLNIIGLSNSAINAYHYDDYLKHSQEKIPWLKFAETFVFHCDMTADNENWDYQEYKTDNAYEAIATLEITTYENIDENINGNEELYTGKSTRPVKKTRRPKNEKKTMAQEAKKAALMEYFKDRFGFTNFDDIHRDELHRPIKM